MYNNKAATQRKTNLISLLICWLIILAGYLMIRILFLILGLQLHLTAQGACLALLPYCFGALQEAETFILRVWHRAPGCCREAGVVFPRGVFVRGQSFPCYGGHGGNRNGRTVCGALYTDAYAVRSEPAVFQWDIYSLRHRLLCALFFGLIPLAKAGSRGLMQLTVSIPMLAL